VSALLLSLLSATLSMCWAAKEHSAWRVANDTGSVARLALETRSK